MARPVVSEKFASFGSCFQDVQERHLAVTEATVFV